MTVYFIDYYRPGYVNGITTYIEILTKSFSTVTGMSLYIVYVAAMAKSKRIITEKVNKLNLIFVPFDLAENGVCNAKDEIFANFIASQQHDDEVILHLNWMNHASFAPLLKKKMEVRTIMTKHCVAWRDRIRDNYELFYTIHSYLQNKGNGNFLLWRILNPEYTVFHNVDGLITLTRDSEHLLTQYYGVKESGVRMIYNATQEMSKDMGQTKEELRDQYGFTDEEQIILYVGRISELKGLQYLSELLVRLSETNRNVHMVVCGSGDWEWFLATIPPNFKSSVTAMGNANKSLLEDMYAICDLAIMPSIVEQCSYVALEYINAQVPFVISSIPGVTELLPKEYRNDFPIAFKPHGCQANIDKLVATVSCLLNNASERKIRAKNCKTYAKAITSVNKMAKDTLAFYKTPLERFHLHLKEEPLVSVIIPCNNSLYLKECLRSVLGQSYSNIEIIVVDDGANDCNDIAKQLDDHRLKVIRNLHNKGIVYSLNKGISYANGRYIARIDADDRMLPDRLAKQVAYLEAHPECGVVGGNHMVINEKGYPVCLVAYPETDAEIKFSRFFMNPLSHPTVTLRCCILRQNKYENTYPYCEDYDLWMRLAKQCKMHNLQDCVTEYRIHQTNCSAKNTKEQKENSLKLILSELWKAHVDVSDDELKVVAACCFGATDTFWSKHKIELDNWISKVATSIESGTDHNLYPLLSYIIRHGLR